MASRPTPFKYGTQLFYALSALAFLAIVVLARPVLLPFLLAILVAYVLFPAVTQVERLRIPRWAAILLVYVVMIGTMVGFSIAVVPRLFQETKNLSAELPKLTQRFRDDWLPKLDEKLRRILPADAKPAAEATPAPPSAPPNGSAAPQAPTHHDGAPIIITPREDGAYEVRLREDLEFHRDSEQSWTLRSPETKPAVGFSSERVLRDAFDKTIRYAQKNSLEVINVGRQVIGGVTRGIFYFFITLMLAGYLMFTYENIYRFLRDMWPEYRRPSFDRFIKRLDRGLGGVVRGQLLICLVNGVLSAIGFSIFGLKYWPILSLIAAVLSIIPIFGSIMSTIPAVAIGLTQGFGTAMGVLLWVIGIHQLEANFLNPKIIGDSAKIHPVLVVFALLFGEHFYQITGALLAVPCLSLAQTVFLHFRESTLGLPASQGALEPMVARGKIPTTPPEEPVPKDNNKTLQSTHDTLESRQYEDE